MTIFSLNRINGNRSPGGICFLLGSLVVLLSLHSVSQGVESREASETLVLEFAGSNENIYSGGEFMSILRGNVVFSYDDMKIESDEATWWKNKGIVNFRNGVVVKRPNQVLKSDRVSFNRDENLLTASGSFFFFDTLEQTSLSGNNARYTLDNREFVLKGDPRLTRFDTAAVETLVISGALMRYSGKEKLAVVEESVSITKGELSAFCERADYFTDYEIVRLMTRPRVYYETHTILGDSVELLFGGEALKSAIVIGNSHVTYTEVSQGADDTTLTNIWSDSLFISVSDSGVLDSIYAFGNVLTRYFLLSDTTTVNEASGRTMSLSFDTLGKIDGAVIRGNARSIYYIDESDGQGRNEASGDSIVVFFDTGKTSRIRLSGSTRGIYFPR